MSNEVVIRIGEVISVEDNTDGLRIKVRTDQDNRVSTEELPYAFPLLPKTLQTIPKKGEAVFILMARLGNKNSMRYYVGPIISQPQYFYNENYNSGVGSSTSLIQGGIAKPLKGINFSDETRGAFPKKEDVAIIGRKSEDIILKDGEIDIRCGIRGEIANVGNNDETNHLRGNVIFNNQSPAYLQLKYQRGICKGKQQVADSVINVVADKINLISHQDVNAFNLTDKDNLIKSEEMDGIMEKLHQLPYGDLLVDLLNRLRLALTNHVHAYPGLPPVPCNYITHALGFDLNTILSDNVRIS